MKLVLLTAALAAALVVSAASAAVHPSPVRTMKDPKLGVILSTKVRKALYTWSREKPGHVKCVGACAKAWPPLLVMSKAEVRKHVKGVMGTFATIRRPDGHLQVTWNRHPLYAFSGDPKGIAKCDGVQGWHVVKA